MANQSRTVTDVSKMTRAERAKYEATLQYKRDYHAARKAEREALLQGQKVRHAVQKGRQEGIEMAIGRVETLLAEKKGLAVRESQIMEELRALLK